MIHRKLMPTELLKVIDKMTNISWEKFEIPPPVFMAMKGEFLSYNATESALRCRFPVMSEHLNPYALTSQQAPSAEVEPTWNLSIKLSSYN